METQTLLLLHEFLKYETRKTKENQETNLMNQNLKIFGNRLGEKLMLRLSSQVSTSKTRDVSAVIKFFLSQFWETLFGKKLENVTVPTNHRISFTDSDFEFINRVSSKGLEAKVYQEHCKHLIRYIIEGAMNALFLKCVVDITIEGRATSFVIECNEMV